MKSMVVHMKKTVVINEDVQEPMVAINPPLLLTCLVTEVVLRCR